MSIKLAHGFSEDLDDLDAAEAALAAARSKLSGPARGALVYLSSTYDPAPVLQLLSSKLVGVPIIGCTVSGLLIDHTHADDGVLVVLLGGDVTCAATLVDLRVDGVKRAAVAVRELCASPGTRLLFVHPMATELEGGLIEAVQQAAGDALVVGGCSGEMSGAGTPLQFFGTQVLTQSMPVLAVSGSFQSSCAIGCGWKPTGRRMRVTSVEGHLVTSLDGKPVFEVLSEFRMSEGIDTLTDTPFAVFPNSTSDDFYVRAVQRIEPERGLRFLSHIPLGAELQCTVAAVEDMMVSAETSAARALEDFKATPDLGLVFSCTARKWRFGPSVREEARRVSAKLPRLPVVGLYVHGEVGPFSPGHSVLHNQTCATLILGS